MRKLQRGFLVLIFILSFLLVRSQELVPNGNFETYSVCPSNLGQIDRAIPWFNPTYASPDYFNTCAYDISCLVPQNWAGFQYPHSGNGYSGIILKYPGEYREYIGVQLLSPLVSGNVYNFKAYIVCSDIYKYWSGNIGIYICNSFSQVPTGSTLPYTPQILNSTSNIPDTINWRLFQGSFTATGGEQYLIIGNFSSDVNTVSTYSNPGASWEGTYLFIDDVSLMLSESLPVQLTEFNVKAVNNTAKISWETSCEINNDFFELQRSLDDLVWAPVYRIQGAGNSNLSNYYQVYDTISGVTYYRLKQIDYDGKFEYSWIIICKPSTYLEGLLPKRYNLLGQELK